MAEFKRISIDQIAVPERLRTVEEEHALAIAQSIVEHGLLNPITVRATPAAGKGATPFTLVAGAHRLRAVKINEDSEIDAIVITADKEEAQLVEIVENIFRNELSVMDRAIFVQSYRDIWEAKFGKVEPGRPGNRANLSQLFAEEAEKGSFSVHVADRMGLSKRSVERLNKIAQNLTPKLREKLRGTPAADNQSVLLDLSKRGPTEQAKIAAGLDEADLPKVLSALAPPKPKPTSLDKQDAAKAELMSGWQKADDTTRSLFIMDRLIEAGADAALARQVKELLARASS
ncbi:chromosome partitioning protein, ParB family [Rhizobium sp. RU35A]|uniref:ParB N-terminal domain-containing protein n=1 Tax=Rhizobium sp. RU35A TaxID=1907414 RepID=UPI0009544357|nr:ParB N-terminal domain-containing protein [Rhizobium sp. RU35A]SIQ24680.1 chromosome partitioning protein, ParB family [Rhizobium sp. RU35A]